MKKGKKTRSSRGMMITEVIGIWNRTNGEFMAK